MGDCLKEGNYNKAQCKSCIFRTDGNQTKITRERLNEIMNYLSTLRSSHICHVTNKACYGGMQIIARSMYLLNMIPDPEVKTMLEEAKKQLNF